MLSALGEKNNYKGEFLTGRSMWIMDVCKVLLGQVTGKHFQMKSNLWTWQNIQMRKNMWKLCPSFIVTTVKSLLCFFSGGILWSTFLYPYHLSSTCVFLLKKHCWSHAVNIVPFLLTCFKENFVSVPIDQYQIYNNTVLELYGMSVPGLKWPFVLLMSVCHGELV